MRLRNATDADYGKSRKIPPSEQHRFSLFVFSVCYEGKIDEIKTKFFKIPKSSRLTLQNDGIR